MVNNRRIVVSAIFGTLFSFFLVIGLQLNHFHIIDFSLGTLLVIVLAAILLSIAFYYLINLTANPKYDEKFKPSKLKIFLLLMAVTTVFFVVVYPGNFCYDISRQLIEYRNNTYSTHYPPAFCFIVGTLVDLGRNIFGSMNGGVAFYVAVQATTTNFVIAHIIVELSKRLKNKTFHKLSVAYFLLHPFVYNLILSTCQDVFFGCAFILVLLELVRISEEKDYFSSKKNFLKLFVYTFLMCILRNNGLFALIPVVIIGLIFLKQRRMKFLLFIGAPIFTFLVGYNLIFLNAINVNRESILHESLNIPVLQIARAIHYDRNVVWDNNLNRFFAEDCEWYYYGVYPALSDSFKLCLKDEAIKRKPLDFVGLWMKIGMEAPNRYIEAPGVSSLVMYYPWADFAKADSIVYRSYIEYGNGVPDEERERILPAADDFLRDFFQDGKTWNKIPVFRIIWGAAFSVYLFLIALALALYRKTKEYVLPLGLIFGILLTIFLAPAVMFRYMFPVVLATPILFYAIIKTVNQKRGKI